MKQTRLRRPSLGTVLGGLALIVAVAGNTNAFSATHVTVHKGDIAKGAVTAKALAAGAVGSKALAKGAVNAKAIKPGAVDSAALGADAVTASAIAPGSVYGGALGQVTLHTAPIADADQVAHNGEWTPSSAVSAICGSGERVVSGGVVFTETGNGQVAPTKSAPYANGAANGFVGQITSDAGGTAKAEVQALCLK